MSWTKLRNQREDSHSHPPMGHPQMSTQMAQYDLDNFESDKEDRPPKYPGKPPVEVVADYLSAVREHV